MDRREYMKSYEEMSSQELIDERSNVKKREREINSILMSRFAGEVKGTGIIPTRPLCSIQTIRIKRSVPFIIEDGRVTKFGNNAKSEEAETLLEYAVSQEVLKPESIKLIYDYTESIAIFDNGEAINWKLDGKEFL